MMLKSSKEIFEILSKGGFISSNSVMALNRAYFDLIEEAFEAYQEYYEGVGFILESGNGYYFFSRAEAKLNVVDKLIRFCDWIDRLDFLKTFNAAFDSGFVFSKAKILERLSCDMELKDKVSKLYVDKKTHTDVVDKLVEDLVKIGFVELENEMENTYKVTAAFHYLEEMVNCLNVVEGVQSEIPE
jgi:hypothetical protein